MKKLIIASVLALGIIGTAQTASARDYDHGWNEQWRHERSHGGGRHYDSRGHLIIESGGYYDPYYAPAYVAPAPVYYAPPPPAYYPPTTGMFVNFRL